MSTVEDYLNELQRALHIRGRLRRRLLAECHDHLQDSTAQYGPDEAIRRFGSAQEIAASMNTEVAAHRAQRATHVTIFAVLVVAGSTLVLLHSSDSRATAPAGWAIVFFAAAQTAALCTALAALQAATQRRQPAQTARDVALLCRRSGFALVAAGITIFAAGGAVPGHAPAWLLLAGPVAAATASLIVLRARSTIRGLPTLRSQSPRSPLNDLSTLIGVALPDVRPTRLLLLTVVLASAAGFVWDHQDQGTTTSALTTAGIQAGLVTLGFLLLGRALGLRPSPRSK